MNFYSINLRADSFHLNKSAGNETGLMPELHADLVRKR